MARQPNGRPATAPAPPAPVPDAAPAPSTGNGGGSCRRNRRVLALGVPPAGRLLERLVRDELDDWVRHEDEGRGRAGP